MTLSDLQPILAKHPFFQGLPPPYLALIVGCAKNARFEAGQHLFTEGQQANDFFLLRRGRIAIEMHVYDKPRIVNTLGPGQVLGWSWLVPPHFWRFDAVAKETVHTTALDGACLREKCEADHDLGYEMLRRFGHDIEERLYGAWTQLADMYSPGEGP